MASAEPGELTPHPLIRALAARILGSADLATARLAAIEPAGVTPSPEAIVEANELATDAIGGFSDPGRREIVMFAGYLGGAVDDDTGGTWRLLYQDANALTWLLVPQRAIVLHERAPDDKAAFQLRDLIWVKSDAPVRQGEEAESRQARFLVGTFTSAGDLHASLTDGGMFPAASGILCAPTPECCMRHSR